jgi:hypothetical protein
MPMNHDLLRDILESQRVASRLLNRPIFDVFLMSSDCVPESTECCDDIIVHCGCFESRDQPK